MIHCLFLSPTFHYRRVGFAKTSSNKNIGSETLKSRLSDLSIGAKRRMADLEHLHNALKLVSDLRSRTGKLWKTASDGTTVNHGGGDEVVKDKRFLSEIKTLLDGVHGQIQ